MLFFRRGRATILCAGAAFFAFTASSARAGAWLQPPGRGEIIAMGRFERSDRMFGRNGRLLPVRGYRKFELKIWMEYGVMDRLSLILAPTASTVRAGAGPGRLHDLQGEVEAGARLGLLRSGSHALSLQVTGLLTNRLSGARIGFARHDVNGADIRLLYGRSFALGSLRAFSEVQAGYRFRAGAGDELRWDATLGVHVTPRLLLLMQGFNLFALRQGRFAAKRQHKLQLSGVYRLNDHWSVQAGAFLTTAARNARRESGVIAAVWRRF